MRSRSSYSTLMSERALHRRNLIIGGHRGHRLANVENLFAGHNPAVAQSAGAEVDVGEVPYR